MLEMLTSRLACSRLAIFLIGLIASNLYAIANETVSAEQLKSAGKYLDSRQQEWFGYAKCISCHSGLPYALAQPSLRKLTGRETKSAQETKMLAQIERRTGRWSELDTNEFGLYYDDSDEKKSQSWGTEAVFNAVILSFNDQAQGRTTPSESTRQAFANLWQTQLKEGENKGAWDWLEFNEAPWGNVEARYLGASLAAIAVGTAPGYYSKEIDEKPDLHVAILKTYLSTQFPKQNLHNRLWALWASARLDGVCTKAQLQATIEECLRLQREDGGWVLNSLGTWKRNDGTEQVQSSDAYATALVLHVLQTIGKPRNDPSIANGLEWIRKNQSETGAWPSVSLVKQRDPKSHTGKFMSDAATAFVILALDH
jgi:squalene-hopene/tetraprenyl-beta-curcumene cyclase